MNKLVLTFFAVTAIALAAEAAPRRDRDRGNRREPPRRTAHHTASRASKKSPSWGWGLNLTSEGLSIGVGARVGSNGVIGLNIPLITREPEVREETVIVQQPIIVQQPVVQQQIVYTEPATRVWVEGHWKQVRDSRGNTVSRTWIPGHWE